jgi:hypothetical protein
MTGFELWAKKNIHILYMVTGAVGGIGIGIALCLLALGYPLEACS